ncbi:MAG TPA: SLC13 family permease, partial [Phycisphaerae bacterium]|nr:SLC13 family permease [Phycisphaerae bacterium]
MLAASLPVSLIVIFLVVYGLIATEKMDKTIAAGLGAALVIGLHYIPYEEALEKVDLNVIFLLIGMMMIVNILAKTGMFE